LAASVATGTASASTRCTEVLSAPCPLSSRFLRSSSTLSAAAPDDHCERVRSSNLFLPKNLFLVYVVDIDNPPVKCQLPISIHNSLVLQLLSRSSKNQQTFFVQGSTLPIFQAAAGHKLFLLYTSTTTPTTCRCHCLGGTPTLRTPRRFT